MLEKTYAPANIEKRIYEMWESSGAFVAGNRPGEDTYTIVIPPPNVTGSLHMGHALNNTLQDILVRYERMRGKDVLWQVGTDHAGIATQMVVERQLAAQGNISRRDMGREAFIERVWQWKEESGGTIVQQLRRLGASCDWSRERFTMDEGLSQAVRKVFVALYKEGLIYKDNRLVNWDPALLTAISDVEVVSKEVKGHLWHVKYPLADGVTYKFPVQPEEEGAPVEWEERDYIVVATTRPETMLGDTAVAVHPEDERYKALVGKEVVLPFTGRRVLIVADDYSDPEKGSGAVKITPAHDFNDFELGRRHQLPLINILTPEGALNDEAPEAYRGLDRFKARAKILADLEELGLLERTEKIVHQVPYGDRSDVVVEPYLTEQWYVRADVLAKPAMEAVEKGDTVFVPKNWEKTYFNWLKDIQPWCISRQLWWGHQIPAWYGPDGHIIVEETEEAAQAAALAHYGQPTEIMRDEDVLDTWFSSALWPFSTLGWPDETPELKRFYKTDVLVTGFDIIFFWVARMMMMGLHFMKEVPFHTVYIHALVRDAHGAKMSKSKGNVMDPLEVIDQYGADALRFTLAAMAAPGRDIKLTTSRVEGYRNFATKLWNSARFAEMNECKRDPNFDPAKVKQAVNQWIVSEVVKTESAISRALESYRFNDAANAIYYFVWGIFCDWYVEFAKPLLLGDDEALRAETRHTVAWMLDQIMVLLHPFMPFLTEELWASTAAQDGFTRDSNLILAAWPTYSEELKNAAASDEMNWVVDLISKVRSVRAEMRVPPAVQVPLSIFGANAETLARVKKHRVLIERLARLTELTEAQVVQPGALQIVMNEAVFLMPVADLIDVDAERNRLSKEVEKTKLEIKKVDDKMANKAFMAKAPEEVIEENKERKQEFSILLIRLEGALKVLGEV